MIQGLTQCTACQGFLPPSALQCPHCQAVPDAATSSAPTRRSPAQKMFEAALLTTGGGLIMTTLMACYGGGWNEAVCDETTNDMDGDCYSAPEDCDDDDPSVHPGAYDVEGDGRDDDCDGQDGPANPDSSQSCGRDCQERVSAESEGQLCSVDPSRDPSIDACLDTCVTISERFGDAVDAALQGCLLSAALCTEDDTLDRCLLEGLYPSGTLHTTTLTGQGFVDQEGSQVLAALKRAGSTTWATADRVTIEGGGFQIVWQEDAPVTSPPQIAWYIDVDEDGLCDPARDLTGQAQALVAGDFETPAFALQLEPQTAPQTEGDSCQAPFAAE